MKIDLRKAYDFVPWGLIEDLLKKLNFPIQFIKWIMACISTPSFSIIINGNTCSFFKGKKGMRQGDPISPLLFVVVMEYLTRILD